MEKKKFTAYEKLVFVVYGYFITVGVLWLSASLYFGGGFSYWAFSLIAVFGSQAYFRQKLTNLIIGVLVLGASIFGSLEFASLGHKISFDGFISTMLGVCVTSLLMSIVLIFSYTKLSFGSE